MREFWWSVARARSADRLRTVFFRAPSTVLMARARWWRRSSCIRCRASLANSLKHASRQTRAFRPIGSKRWRARSSSHLKLRRKITRQGISRSVSVNTHYGFDEQPYCPLHCRLTWPFTAGQEILDPIPLVVSQPKALQLGRPSSELDAPIAMSIVDQLIWESSPAGSRAHYSNGVSAFEFSDHVLVRRPPNSKTGPSSYLGRRLNGSFSPHNGLV